MKISGSSHGDKNRSTFSEPLGSSKACAWEAQDLPPEVKVVNGEGGTVRIFVAAERNSSLLQTMLLSSDRAAFPCLKMPNPD